MMRSCSTKTILFLMAFCLLPLSGCRPQVETPEAPALEFQDRSWLENVPCEPPCWYGLTPGQSKPEDVLDTMDQLSFAWQESFHAQVFYYRSDRGDWAVEKEFRINYRKSGSALAAQLFFSDDLLQQISLHPNFPISMREAVETIGEPDGMVVHKKFAEGKGCYTEIFWYSKSMAVYSADRGLNLGADDLCDVINESNNQIPGDILISEVKIFTADEMAKNYQGTSIELWNGFIEDN